MSTPSPQAQRSPPIGYIGESAPRSARKGKASTNCRTYPKCAFAPTYRGVPSLGRTELCQRIVCFQLPNLRPHAKIDKIAAKAEAPRNDALNHRGQETADA